MTMPLRFREHGWSAAYSFGTDVLVVCPRCSQRARVFPHPVEPPDVAAWRVTCLNCGYAKDKPTVTRTFDNGRQQPVRDPVFRLPLWLQASCCGGKLLWAYNIGHLDVLEEFDSATIREKRCAECGHPHHQRMIHKLPAWMKSARNRDELLVVIGKLRETVGPQH